MSTGPWITEEIKDNIIRKLEPLLRSGRSVNKACLEAQVPDSTVSDIMKEDKKFAERIRLAEEHWAIMTNDIYTDRLRVINNKIAITNEARVKLKNKEITKEEFRIIENENYITKEDWDFIMWISTKSKKLKDYFGERQEVELTDPQQRIKEVNKLIKESEQILSNEK
jgi:hypothetical protein